MIVAAVSEIATRAMTMLERAERVEITDMVTYEAAVELARAIKDLRAEAEAHHRPVIQAALEAHRKALEAFRRIDEPLRSAELELKRRIAAWSAEQERRRLEAERRAREEAERLAAEAIEAQIEQLKASGATPEHIAAVISEAQRMPVIAPTAPPASRPQGVSTRKHYRAVVRNLMALIRWVAEHPTHESLLEPNQSALNALARAQGASLDIPGVQVIVEETVAIKR